MNLPAYAAQAAFRRHRPDLWSRRDFLRTASSATLAALAAGSPRALLASTELEKIAPTADRVIVLVDGGRHGAHGDLRSEALHTVLPRA
jgi:hypothetical protein